MPPEKPDDLVREHRADDERDVVLDHRAVEPDVDGLVQQAAGQLGDPVGADACRASAKVAGSHHSWLSTVIPG